MARLCDAQEFMADRIVFLNTLNLYKDLQIRAVSFSLNKMENRRKAILTGLLRGDFFPVEGAVLHTRATIKPCSRPLRDIESHVAVQHKLIKSNFKSMRVVRVVLTMFFFGFSLFYKAVNMYSVQHYILKLLDCCDKPHPFSIMFNLECPQISALFIKS